ncbi:MAG TPA: ribonuclease E inhibitor RraB [Dehalococcoidia bacterium]|jgi:hypothetical protein|nr:ribonuclease E inhibitor RraB [Dehalococcoidia bacterium]
MSLFGRKRQNGDDRTDDIGEPKLTHYLYFETRATAEAAGETVRIRGYDIDVLKSADDKQWLLLAVGGIPVDEDTVDDNRDYFESLAGSLGGEYDGWEMGPFEQG